MKNRIQLMFLVLILIVIIVVLFKNKQPQNIPEKPIVKQNIDVNNNLVNDDNLNSSKISSGEIKKNDEIITLYNDLSKDPSNLIYNCLYSRYSYEKNQHPWRNADKYMTAECAERFKPLIKEDTTNSNYKNSSTVIDLDYSFQLLNENRGYAVAIVMYDLTYVENTNSWTDSIKVEVEKIDGNWLISSLEIVSMTERFY